MPKGGAICMCPIGRANSKRGEMNCGAVSLGSFTTAAQKICEFEPGIKLKNLDQEAAQHSSSFHWCQSGVLSALQHCSCLLDCLLIIMHSISVVLFCRVTYV